MHTDKKDFRRYFLGRRFFRAANVLRKLRIFIGHNARLSEVSLSLHSKTAIMFLGLTRPASETLRKFVIVGLAPAISQIRRFRTRKRASPIRRSSTSGSRAGSTSCSLLCFQSVCIPKNPRLSALNL